MDTVRVCKECGKPITALSYSFSGGHFYHTECRYPICVVCGHRHESGLCPQQKVDSTEDEGFDVVTQQKIDTTS